MKFHFFITEAVQALRTNALRSSLTIIGIVVGIFSVTTMLALGEGLSSNVLERFNSFTTGDITISGDLTQTDLNWIQEQPYISGVLANQSINNVTTIAGGSSFNPSISTALGDYETIGNLTILSGTNFDFTDINYDEHVALVDEGFVETVQDEAGIDISEGTLTLNGQHFTVIGVMEGGNTGFGRRSDGSIIIPYASALGIVTDTKVFSSIGVTLKEQEYYEIAAIHILESLNASRYANSDSSDYFSVSSAQDAIENVQETTKMISLFLGVIGGIALFVGGIGTMNMMLTTVTERTKEIGLRKAIGARDSDVLYQILTESIALTVIGGLIGIGLTYLLAFLANQTLESSSGQGMFSEMSLEMSNEVVVYATLVSFMVGIVFGIYPARNASKLQPVDALRSE
ncbi:ABC transporter permease [Candidatus Kaiserbacteria bacterium]|nr:ABC transporter permease [Candidatus Kaiserbacteria bacterium]